MAASFLPADGRADKRSPGLGVKVADVDEWGETGKDDYVFFGRPWWDCQF
jgi:hypothetical protein